MRTGGGGDRGRDHRRPLRGAGRPPRRLRRRAEAGLPGQGPGVPSRRQPGRLRHLRAVQGGQPGLRGAEGSRAPGPLRPLRRRGGLRPRRRRGRPGRPVRWAVWATCSTPSSTAWAVRGRRAGAAGPGPMPGPDAEMVLAPDLPGGGLRGASARSTCRPRCTATPARVRGPGRAPRAVRCPECQGAGELRRVRQSILGQVITAVPCPRCQGTGEFIETPLRRLPGRGAAERVADPDRRHPGRGRRGVDPPAGRPRAGRVPGWAQRRPVRPPRRSSPTPSSSAPASTSTPPSTCR